jgi:hypothetical protein
MFVQSLTPTSQAVTVEPVAVPAPLVQVAIPTGDDKKPKPDDKDKKKLSLVFSGASHHFGQRGFMENGTFRHFNEFNPGLGVEYRFGRLGSFDVNAGAGFYRNSVYNTSKYVSVGVETNGSKFIGAGIDAGLLTGYPDMGSTIAGMPLVAIPHLRIGEADKVNLKVEVIPPIKNLTPMTVGVQVRVPIK